MPKFIDREKSWIIDARVCPKGVPFEASDYEATQIARLTSTLEHYEEPKPVKAPEDVPEAPKSEEPKPEAEDGSGITATYTSGGWYELSDGRKLRRKDFPDGVEVIEE